MLPDLGGRPKRCVPGTARQTGAVHKNTADLRTFQDWAVEAFRRGHRLQEAPFEDATYVHPRFPKRRLHGALARMEWRDRTLDQPGWLRIAGRDGAMVLGPVWHDGDAYVRRHAVHGEIAGSARLLTAHGLPEATLVTDRDLVEEALARGEFVRIEREFDRAVLDVALLGPWPDWRRQKRTPALRFQGDRLLAFNPEPQARMPFNTPLVRHRILARLVDDALKRRLEAWRDRLDPLGNPPDPWPRATGTEELMGLIRLGSNGFGCVK